MGLEIVGIGNQPEDGLGDGLRTAFSKTNSNMREVFARSFVYNNTLVNRWVDADYSDPDLNNYLVNDRVQGWVDAGKTHYIDGIVKDNSFVFPDDIDDKSKFFKLVEKIQNEIV